MAVGCDLRNTTKLSKILEEKLEIVSYTVLCVAKVSSTYMDIDAADALIKWAAQYNDVTDCQIEDSNTAQRRIADKDEPLDDRSEREL
ncbi:MAG: hypothetical protein LQ343_007203 [Gyalolechia ehrenbergii]|nr:MAG: hypothetical protein LQ343_007203 [Gyalolechia ehrenbergii]